MAGKLIVRLANRMDELQRLTTALEEFGKVQDLAPNALTQTELALEELFTNIVSYGYDDDEKHEIEISIDAKDNALHIDIYDDGVQFDPLAPKKEVDLEASLEDIAIGGHGINLVKAFMTNLAYNYEDGRNHFHMEHELKE